MTTKTLLSHLGHDLRNPGTTLVSCIELLREIVDDPEGREAVEDAELALGQLERAWARVDVLAGHFAPALSEDTDLHAVFEQVARAHAGTCSAPPDARGPAGWRFVLDGLLEATRKPTVEVTRRPGALVVAIRDARGVVQDLDLRAHAFELDRQSDMKNAGRYSRFLGLVAAKRAADHLGIELVSAEDCVFRLSRAA